MGTKIPGTVLTAFLLFLLLAASFSFSPFWHSLAQKQESVSYSLYSYDRQFAEGQKACFSLEIIASNVQGKRQENLLASSEGKTLLAERIETPENGTKEYCFSTQNLGQKSLVEIFIGEERLFYALEKTSIAWEAKPSVSIQGISVLKGGQAEVKFDAKNVPENKAAPVEIFVNGKLDHRFYPEKGREEFSEKIFLDEGHNSVRVSVFGASAETSAFYEKPFTLPFWAGIFVMALAFFVLNSFVFGKSGSIGGGALSLAGIAALFMANGFILNLFSLLNALSFSALLLAELALLALLCRKNFSLKEFTPKKSSFSLIETILFLFFVFFTLLLPFFMPSHQSAWSIYYERQANSVAENFSIPRADELSYLGRPFSFVPGYFLFGGAIYWLTGSLGTQMFAITMAFSNLFLLLSALFFASRLGLISKDKNKGTLLSFDSYQKTIKKVPGLKSFDIKRNQAALFVVFLSMSTFVFTTYTLTPRHGIALSLLLVSLALLFGKEKWRHSSVFLAAGLAVQIPLAVFYPLIAFFAMQKFDWKKTSKALLGGLALFSPFLALMLFYGGLPLQAMPRLWGYIAPMPAQGLLQNPGLLFVFFCLFALFEAFLHFSGKPEWDPLRKRLLLGAFASCILQVFASSRADLASAVLIAAFLAYSLQKYERELSDFAFFLFGLILLFGLALAILVEPHYIYSQAEKDSLKALRQNSSTGDRVLCDPYYGHKIAFESGRITLADLMVEYADHEKLSDSYGFLDSGDVSILDKYGLSLVFAENRAIYRSSFKTETLAEPIEFASMDKVFTNSSFSVHRKR